MLIVLVALLASAAVALGGGTAGAPKQALVTSQGLRTGSVLGSYCSSGPGVSGCGDAAYPLPVRTHVPVVPGSVVRANVRKRARSLNAYLVHVEGDGMNDAGGAIVTKPVKHSHRRIWRLRMPDHLGDANVLSIQAQFARGGDANWWAGIKPVDQWP
jgi:hypothetical protein